MKTNTRRASLPVTTHEGARTVRSSALKELRRSIMACMLFEDQFYEDGASHADRVKGLCAKVSLEELAEVAIDAREKFKLRHAPLLLVREAIRLHKGRRVGDLIHAVIQRPDELGELLALYWKDQPNSPLSSQLKIGLARAFKKFNEYQLAKWNKDSAITLRDVMFLAHPKVEMRGDAYTAKERKRERAGKEKFKLTDREQLFKRLADEGKLEAPDTWEVELSAGGDKRATFTRLLVENKLGALALLRNLRNMIEAKVPEDLIREGLRTMKTERVLPFRFITAARYAPRLEDALEQAMFRCAEALPKLTGKTALLIDHSGSMSAHVSSKSEISRFDAAAALAMILRETADRCRVFTFSDRCIEVAPRRGFALLAAVKEVVNPTSTYLGAAVKHVYREFPECDRIIVITDEQSHDRPGQPHGTGYIVNVAGHRNGIAYGQWVSIDGWSEAILDYIREYEAEG